MEPKTGPLWVHFAIAGTVLWAILASIFGQDRSTMGQDYFKSGIKSPKRTNSCACGNLIKSCVFQVWGIRGFGGFMGFFAWVTKLYFVFPKWLNVFVFQRLDSNVLSSRLKTKPLSIIYELLPFRNCGQPSWKQLCKTSNTWPTNLNLCLTCQLLFLSG